MSLAGQGDFAVLQAEDARVVLRSRSLHCAECGLPQGAIVRDSQVLVTPPGDPGNFGYPIELVELDDEAEV